MNLSTIKKKMGALGGVRGAVAELVRPLRCLLRMILLADNPTSPQTVVLLASRRGIIRPKTTKLTSKLKSRLVGAQGALMSAVDPTLVLAR